METGQTPHDLCQPGHHDDGFIFSHTLEDNLGAFLRGHRETLPSRVGLQPLLPAHIDHGRNIKDSGPDKTRTSNTHLHAQVGTLYPHGLGKAHNGELAGHIRSRRGKRQQTFYGGQVDNMTKALFGHLLVSQQRPIKHTVQIHIQNLAPVIYGHVTQITCDGNAGVIKNIVKPAFPGNNVFYRYFKAS